MCQMQYLPLTFYLLKMIGYRITVIFILFFTLVSCEIEPKIIFSESVFESDNSVVYISLPVVEGNSDLANTINTAVRSIAVKSLSISDTLTLNGLENKIKDFDNSYNEFRRQFPDFPGTWEAQIEGEVLYQSSEIISIGVTSYINTGGAHGITHIDILNFNSESGKQLFVSDLISNVEGFRETAASFFNEEIKNKSVRLFKTNSFTLPQNIGYSQEGIILLYNVHEIAPYSSGIIEFTIPYGEVSNYLNYY